MAKELKILRYMKNKKDEVILLEPREVQWRDDSWQIMTRYFDIASYVVPTYKYRMHYEIILSSIGSAEFQHFYPINTKKVYISNLLQNKYLPYKNEESTQ